MDTIERFDPAPAEAETEPLSPAARTILARVVEQDLLLTPNPYWRAVRSFEFRDSLAPDWRIDDEIAEELVAAGCLALRTDIELYDLYQHTEDARQVLA